MKKTIKICALFLLVSCSESRLAESSEPTKNSNNIFAGTRTNVYKPDIEKRIGRPLTIQ